MHASRDGWFQENVSQYWIWKFLHSGHAPYQILYTLVINQEILQQQWVARPFFDAFYLAHCLKPKWLLIKQHGVHTSAPEVCQNQWIYCRTGCIPDTSAWAQRPCRTQCLADLQTTHSTTKWVSTKCSDMLQNGFYYIQNWFHCGSGNEDLKWSIYTSSHTAVYI